jgi:flagellar basal-body rod protein FlgB
MINKIEGSNALDKALDFNAQALTLRARRQGVLAANIANADTPGFKAQDFDFAQALQQATVGGQAGGQSGKVGTATSAAEVQLKARETLQAATDENTVDLDTERTAFSDNAIRYEAALRSLNGQIKTLLSAIQG